MFRMPGLLPGFLPLPLLLCAVGGRDQAGRDHMTLTDGQEDSWDKMEDYLRSLLKPTGPTS